MPSRKIRAVVFVSVILALMLLVIAARSRKGNIHVERKQRVAAAFPPRPIPVAPRASPEDELAARELLEQAMDFYDEDLKAYREVLKALKGRGIIAEQVLHDMYVGDPSDFLLILLCDFATEFSEPFFLKVAMEYSSRIGTSTTSKKIIEFLSVLRSNLLLENIGVFRKGLHFDTAGTFTSTIYYHLRGYGEKLVPFLAEVLGSELETALDKAGAAATMGAIGTPEAAQILYDSFRGFRRLEELRPSLIGIAHLPGPLMAEMVNRYLERNPKDPRDAFLIYHSLQAKDAEGAQQILSSVMFNPALRDALKTQALVASRYRDETGVSDILVQYLVSAGANAALRTQASSVIASLSAKGAGNYKSIRSAFEEAKESSVRISLAEALSNFNQLMDNPGAAQEIRSKIETLEPAGDAEQVSLTKARTKLARTASDPAGELLALAKRISTDGYETRAAMMQSQQAVHGSVP